MLFVSRRTFHLVLVFLLVLVIVNGKISLPNQRSLRLSTVQPSSSLPTLTLTEKSKILAVRGGKTGTSIKGKKPIGVWQKLRESVQSIEFVTRAYVLLTLFCTVVHLTGLPAPKVFALDSSRLYEIWRPFTSVAYFGAPSMSMANSLYFLISYGQTLEREYGSGTHAWFLFLQILILTGLGFLLQFPIQSQAMIAAIVYVSSRLNAMQQIPFQFGFMITSWQLPFCMMIIDCLSQQNLGAAWPHILGIFSGHVYYFFTEVWPKLGGKEYLKSPQLFIRLFGDKPSSNIDSLSSSKQQKKKGKPLSTKSSKLFTMFTKKNKGKKLN